MRFFYFLLPFIFWSSAFGLAGGNSGGGGVGVVCRDSSNKVNSVELLDLWEARVIYGRNLLTTEVPFATQLDDAIEKAKKTFYFPIDVDSYGQNLHGYELTKAAIHYDSESFLQPSGEAKWLTGVRLTRTEDSFELAVPQGCEIEQVVNYIDSFPAQILINKDLFDKMNETNKAALILHESLYRVLRRYSHENNSIRTRRIVGMVMSGNPLPSVHDWVAQKHRLQCRNSPNSANFTSVHLIYYVAGIAIVPEVIQGVWMFGFPSLTGTFAGFSSVDQFVQSFDPNSALEVSILQLSPVAYDDKGYVKIIKNSSGQFEMKIRMIRWTNGSSTIKKLTVPCQITEE